MNKCKVEEAPMERLGLLSAKSFLFDVSDEELLQVIMPKEAACNLLAEYSNAYEALMNTSSDELAQIKGMGRSKIYKIECLREIVRRFYHQRSSRVTVIRSPKDAFEFMADMQELKQEQFRIIILNTKNKIIGQKTISQGTINATLVSPREIFNAAIKNMAASIILVHNPAVIHCQVKKTLLLLENWSKQVSCWILLFLTISLLVKGNLRA